MPKKSEKSTNSEQKIWEDIFSYIKRNIFNYTEEQKLSKFLVMRVKGLAYGQHYLHKPTKNHPEPIKQIYSAEAVYWTLVSCTPTILKTFTNAKDENHKVNLLCTQLELISVSKNFVVKFSTASVVVDEYIL